MADSRIAPGASTAVSWGAENKSAVAAASQQLQKSQLEPNIAALLYETRRGWQDSRQWRKQLHVSLSIGSACQRIELRGAARAPTQI